MGQDIIDAAQDLHPLTNSYGSLDFFDFHSTVSLWQIQNNETSFSSIRYTPVEGSRLRDGSDLSTDSPTIASNPSSPIPPVRETHSLNRTRKLPISVNSSPAPNSKSSKRQLSKHSSYPKATPELRRRNATAARKCRDRRRESNKELESVVRDIESRNASLVKLCQVLRGELYLLQNLAMKHVGCECDALGALEADIFARAGRSLN